MWKREEIASKENISSFPPYFQCFSNFRVKLNINLWNVVVWFIFSSILQIWYVELGIFRSIYETPFDLEITRIDCIWSYWNFRISLVRSSGVLIVRVNTVFIFETAWGMRESFLCSGIAVPSSLTTDLSNMHRLLQFCLYLSCWSFCWQLEIYSFVYVSIVSPVSILHKSIAGRYRPVRVAEGPITARCRFIKNASWVILILVAQNGLKSH